jgi:hypothetical protein
MPVVACLRTGHSIDRPGVPAYAVSCVISPLL